MYLANLTNNIFYYGEYRHLSPIFMAYAIIKGARTRTNHMQRYLILLSLPILLVFALSASLVAAQDNPQPTTTTIPLQNQNTPSPTRGEISHLVRDGENLYTIAALYQVTVGSIADLNGITDYNRVLIGQNLRIPSGTSPLAPPAAATAPPTLAPTLTPAPVNEAEAVGFAYGIQVEFSGQDTAQIAAQVTDLGLSWVGLRVDWSRYETTRGQINFDALDAVIQPLDSAGLNILLTVTSAPAWARSTSQESGPPNVNADYGAFVGSLAARYLGIVDAYEIWTTPNLRREWNGKPLSGVAYVELLKAAYNAIKTSDPAALVITAGLAPTATNDGVNALDDRAFLTAMYAAGAGEFSDGIGVQAWGWANPPDSSCCQTNRPAVSGWDDQPAFFFLDTLSDYRAIMNANDDGGTFLWVTHFGWGSSAGISATVHQDEAYIAFTDAQEQAQYITRAFHLGRDLTFVGPMLLSNLNACVVSADSSSCYYSLIGPDGTPRLPYQALKALEK